MIMASCSRVRSKHRQQAVASDEVIQQLTASVQARDPARQRADGIHEIMLSLGLASGRRHGPDNQFAVGVVGIFDRRTIG